MYRNPRIVIPSLSLLLISSLLLATWRIKTSNAISIGGIIQSEKILETCGLVTDVCRLKYIAVSSNDPQYSHRYLICDVLYEHGCADKIIPVDSVPAETLQINRHALLEDNWFVRIRTEWYHIKDDNGIIGGGCELKIPQGEDVETISDSQVRRHLSKSKCDNNNHNYYHEYRYDPFISTLPSGMSRKLTTGVKTFVLAVVNADEISLTETEMYDYIYGAEESLASQLDDCSHGLTTIIPRPENALVYVQTTNDIETYDFNTMFLNLAGPDPDLRSDFNLRDIYGIENNQPLSAIADHIMFIIPDAIAGGNSRATGWAANPGFYLGIKESWLESAQNNLHELGHNFGLEHNFEDGAEYFDQTTVMGASFRGTHMCFNGFHFSLMEWYQDRKFTLVPTDLPTSGYKVDLAFYGHYEKTNANQPVFIQLLGYTNNYITLNRKAGINRETIEYGDEVIIVQDRDPNPGTELVSHLPMEMTMEGGWQTFFGDSKNVIVRLCGYTPETETSPDFVTLAISTRWDSACDFATYIGETREPTSLVTAPPSPFPTQAEELVTIYVAITYDNNPEETGWFLTNPLNGDIISESPKGTVSTAAQTIITPVNLLHGNYTFEITDQGQNGICCSNGLGKVEIYQEVYVGIMNIDDGGKLYIGFSSGKYGAGATINIQTWRWPQ